jgi:radical SAM superfamily enzyme YgiQ (UPF0313 family)
MPDILLCTLNARYSHASLGLRYLRANLGALRDRSAILEFEARQEPADIVASILRECPRIVGLGVYIWNARACLEVATLLKRVCPKVFLVLGGPEVSYETEDQPIVAIADAVICGEADVAFRELCERILDGGNLESKVVQAGVPEFASITLPYEEYTDEDLAHRVLYVEASRGCPYKCQFCLSSLDVPVREAPLEAFLDAMNRLLDRGARQLKFVDRTFNLNLRVVRRILESLRSRKEPGLFFHFEMIPDRLPGELLELLTNFPPGSIQLELGIQTFDPEVGRRIERRQDVHRVEANLRALQSLDSVHVHADLIAGLPGEDLKTFAAGFDRLVALGPQEIQVGILKRLKGTPITRHDQSHAMVYSPFPPFEILSTKDVTYEDMTVIKDFARTYDLVANSGNFLESVPLLIRDASPFDSFRRLTERMIRSAGRVYSLPLARWAEEIFLFATEELRIEADVIGSALARDFARGGRTDVPGCLLPWKVTERARTPKVRRELKRQDRRLQL